MNIERLTIISLVHINDWWQWIAVILNYFLIVDEFRSGLAIISCCLWDQGDHAQCIECTDPARYAFRVLYEYFVIHQHKSIISEKRFRDR